MVFVRVLVWELEDISWWVGCIIASLRLHKRLPGHGPTSLPLHLGHSPRDLDFGLRAGVWPYG